MTVLGGEMPDFVLRGSWEVLFGDEKLQMTPNRYGVMFTPVSQQEWDDLRKSQTTINVESLYYKPLPPEPPKDAPDSFYLLYSRDRSATIGDPYFARTPPVKGPNGVMIFVGGKGPPPLENNWAVLGRTYFEVWSDPNKLTLYNSLYPPDTAGLPRAFGFFAGAENIMAGPVSRALSAPTTRAADILDFKWPNQIE
jgi:hypothetical protein